MIGGPHAGRVVAIFAAVAIALAASTVPGSPDAGAHLDGAGSVATVRAATGNGSALGNFSAALGRIVALLGAAGGAVLAIAWSRVALSWFSTDVTKKIQAKDRARDALIGTLIFTAALSGLVWGLAQWILTGA